MNSSAQSKLKAGVICLSGALIVLMFYLYYPRLWVQTVKFWHLFQNRHQLKVILRSYGPYSPLVFILFQIIQVVVAPIPGEAIEFLGGYVFGVWAGMLYSMIGLILGSLFAFGIARIFEKKAVEKFVSPKLRRKFDYLIGHQGAILSFLLFLIPGFPKDALCYILGLTPMSLGIFFVISTIGRIPGTLIAVLQGAKAFEQQYKTLLILIGVSALMILIFYIYHEDIHRWIKKRTLDDAQEKEG